MSTFFTILEWIAWAISAFLTLNFILWCRIYVRNQMPFQWATAVQGFFFFIITIVFFITPLNKLHIFWLLPASFLFANLLVLLKIPILSPLVLFLTKIYLKITLIGLANIKNQRSDLNSIWDCLLEKMKEVEGSNDFLPSLKIIVKTFFVPDNINPFKFSDNFSVFINHNKEIACWVENRDINPTPSLEKLIYNHAPGYPSWFIAAYPDVATWFSNGIENAERSGDNDSIFLNLFSNISEDEMVDEEGHFKCEYLRTVINTYQKETGLTFECSN